MQSQKPCHALLGAACYLSGPRKGSHAPAWGGVLQTWKALAQSRWDQRGMKKHIESRCCGELPRIAHFGSAPKAEPTGPLTSSAQKEGLSLCRHTVIKTIAG